MDLTHAGDEPVLPQVVYRWPNGATLTAREYAIAEARQWQLTNMPESGVPAPAYSVIVGLLSLIPDHVLTRVYQKAGLS